MSAARDPDVSVRALSRLASHQHSGAPTGPGARGRRRAGHRLATLGRLAGRGERAGRYRDCVSVTLADGTRLWTDVRGSGPPIVFCHGGPGLWDYLGPLAEVIGEDITAIRFEQRGCGRSGGMDGPFTIAQAIADLDGLRDALGIARWQLLGHSWGAELALRYAADHPERASGVVYLAGVGAGDGFRPAFRAEHTRRLGTDLARWRELGARERSADEEREWCLLQWRPDFAPSGDPAAHAATLWATRPAGIVVNHRANAQLWAERSGTDLLDLAAYIRAPVAMIAGADDPRPWSATDDLLAALPHAHRTVLEGAGHAPWAERPDETRALIRAAIGVKA